MRIFTLLTIYICSNSLTNDAMYASYTNVRCHSDGTGNEFFMFFFFATENVNTWNPISFMIQQKKIISK